MEKKMDISSVEKVRGFELKKVGSVADQKLTSILIGLLYQLEEEDVQLLGGEEVNSQATVLGLLYGMHGNLNAMLQLVFDST
jgi:hypothetical protein